MKKLTFEDVKNIIDNLGFYEGEAEMWLEQVWTLAERHGYSSFETPFERLNALAFIYGMCRIYLEFTALIDDFECDTVRLDIDYESLTTETFESEELCLEDEEDHTISLISDTLREYVNTVIFNENNIRQVFKVLGEELGSSSKVFASLYYCRNYERYSLQSWETDEFYYDGDPEAEPDDDYEQRKLYASMDGIDEIYDNILGMEDFSKMPAFEWISEYLR